MGRNAIIVTGYTMPELRPNTATAILMGCLLPVLLAACGESDRPSRLPAEVVERRAEYDMTRPWSDLARPHFFALDEDGRRREMDGQPDLIVVHDGLIKVRLAGGGRRYVDLLALESERLGEHPVHKVFRLEAMGVALEDGLADRLRPASFHDDLFRTLTFDYVRDRQASGVVTELFPDGTFLVMPYGDQAEWQSGDDAIASPSHFHVDPRALSAGDSALARQYEDEILALSFDDQRYPPVDVARRQCGVFTESRSASEYASVLESVGYAFTSSSVDTNDDEAGFGARAALLLRRGSGAGVSYFGYESRWSARRLADFGAGWVGECDAVSGLRTVAGSDGEAIYYTIVRRSLEPDRTQRYKVVSVDADGSAAVLHSPPGIVLLALPLPSDPGRWMLSAEGWPSNSDGRPADPRFQAVYLAHVDSPETYELVRYPISRYPRAPASLYGSAGRLSDDSRYLVNNLYGSEDEGGGLWIVDLEDEGFHADEHAFARIVPWDHALSWFTLGPADMSAGQVVSVFLTAKEVDRDFAMTANLLRITGAGLEARVESQRRLARMVGWNPVPFAVQRLDDTRFRVAVETHYNYEASLMPRATGVYFVDVDTDAK